MRLQWTPALAVGIEEVDAQHRELFRRAGRLLESLHEGSPEALGPVIDFLHEYAVLHFGAEEEAMRASGFPGYVRHKAEHDRFIRDLLGLSKESKKRGAGALVALKVGQWLGEWLRQHVSGTDMEMARFLARRSA
jgi:hemerythrin